MYFYLGVLLYHTFLILSSRCFMALYVKVCSVHLAIKPSKCGSRETPNRLENSVDMS